MQAITADTVIAYIISACRAARAFNKSHRRSHIGANGVSGHPGKMVEKLKSENMQKSSFLNGGWGVKV